MAKELRWAGRSLDEPRAFPPETRRETGHQLRRVQLGMAPADWNPMPVVGPGVVEIRIHGETEYRVFYVAKYHEAVYVLRAFEKQRRATARRDIDVGRKRLRELEEWRRAGRL